MDRKKILIIGSRSFASKGLPEKLEKLNLDVTCFNRGEVSVMEKNVTGPMMEMTHNPWLSEGFDVVINYVFLKNESIQLNLKYIDSLIEFCRVKNVKQLIQISSVSVYPNNSQFINEKSAIENEIENKGDYASVKTAVDKYLLSFCELKFSISFVRPGFIVTSEVLPSLTGILKLLPFNTGVLMGNKETTLPIIDREVLNEAITQIIVLDKKESVYLVISKQTETKYNFVRSKFDYRIIPLPKKVTLFVAKVFLSMKIFNARQYLQVKGLFKTTVFDCSCTEKNLNINF